MIEGGGEVIIPPDVDELGAKLGVQHPHLQLLGWFLGVAEDPLLVIDGLFHRGVEQGGAVVAAKVPRGEAGPLRIEVGEGGHHIAATGQSHQPILFRYSCQLPGLFPQAIVGQGLDGPDRLQLVRVGHVLIEADGGIVARDDAKGLLILQLARWRHRGHQAMPPRQACRRLATS
ncbi:hypothetical protein D3C78_1209950 [compost metagenome]